MQMRTEVVNAVLDETLNIYPQLQICFRHWEMSSDVIWADN